MISSSRLKESGVKYRAEFASFNAYFLDSIKGVKDIVLNNAGAEREKEVNRRKSLNAIKWLEYCSKYLNSPLNMPQPTAQKGSIIAMITSDIETLEVFYAHTISPIAIAVLVSTAQPRRLSSYLS